MKEHQDFDIYIGRTFDSRQLRSQDLELFFVLDGKARLRLGDDECFLEKSDMAIANIGEERGIGPVDSMIVCAVRFVQGFVWEYCQHKYPVFSM